ncbi:MAG: hypothetical protein HC827_13725 [Cyanobacteria bacterium RM1_2_2]|nr:hypothetical protein [Cyanobacteria bacterium RM1_2_2]
MRSPLPVQRSPNPYKTRSITNARSPTRSPSQHFTDLIDRPSQNKFDRALLPAALRIELPNPGKVQGKARKHVFS